eukprot:21471-Heterococcus_DN1.PRE.9
MPYCLLELAATVLRAFVPTSALWSCIFTSTLSGDSVLATKYSISQRLVRTTHHVRSQQHACEARKANGCSSSTTAAAYQKHAAAIKVVIGDQKHDQCPTPALRLDARVLRYTDGAVYNAGATPPSSMHLGSLFADVVSKQTYDNAMVQASRDHLSGPKMMPSAAPVAT